MAFVSLTDLVYPVGSFYISYDAANPATKFGGTWTSVTGMIKGNSSVGSDGHPISHTGQNINFNHTHLMRLDLSYKVGTSQSLPYTQNNYGVGYHSGDASIPKWGICTHLSSWNYPGGDEPSTADTQHVSSTDSSATPGGVICEDIASNPKPWFGTRLPLNWKTPSDILNGITYQDAFVWRRTA